MLQPAPTHNGYWRNVLRSQGRSLAWLAKATGRSPRTVYGYSRGVSQPVEGWDAWLALVSAALGEEVTR